METKPYKEDEQPEHVVCEPEAAYGATESYLDPAVRYTYADYLTWTDNIRTERNI